mgnify:CR=1 FL=1
MSNSGCPVSHCQFGLGGLGGGRHGAERKSDHRGHLHARAIEAAHTFPDPGAVDADGAEPKLYGFIAEARDVVCRGFGTEQRVIHEEPHAFHLGEAGKPREAGGEEGWNGMPHTKRATRRCSARSSGLRKIGVRSSPAANPPTWAQKATPPPSCGMLPPSSCSRNQ